MSLQGKAVGAPKTVLEVRYHLAASLRITHKMPALRAGSQQQKLGV